MSGEGGGLVRGPRLIAASPVVAITEAEASALHAAAVATFRAFLAELERGDSLTPAQYSALLALGEALSPFTDEDPDHRNAPDPSRPPGAGEAHLRSGAGQELLTPRPAAEPISSAELIARLDQPRIRDAVNIHGSGRHA